MAVDPRNCTNFARTDYELQEYWLFCISVAGKTAMTQAQLLEGFLVMRQPGQTPFDYIKDLIEEDDLLECIKLSRLGQYTRLARAFASSIHLNLRTCTVEQLESIPGVGAKTARYFLLHTRKDQKIAALDTHVLHYLRDRGLTTQKVTPPSGKKYQELEALFIKEAETAKMSIADFDLHIWRTYSGNT